MEEQYGPDLITITDEDGNAFELEHLDTLSFRGETYMAFLPAGAEGNEDDDDYGIILLKVVEVDGEEELSTLESEEELEAVYQQFMEILFDGDAN